MKCFSSFTRPPAISGPFPFLASFFVFLQLWLVQGFSCHASNFLFTCTHGNNYGAITTKACFVAYFRAFIN